MTESSSQDVTGVDGRPIGLAGFNVNRQLSFGLTPPGTPFTGAPPYYASAPIGSTTTPPSVDGSATFNIGGINVPSSSLVPPPPPPGYVDPVAMMAALTQMQSQVAQLQRRRKRRPHQSRRRKMPKLPGQPKGFQPSLGWALPSGWVPLFGWAPTARST